MAGLREIAPGKKGGWVCVCDVWGVGDGSRGRTAVLSHREGACSLFPWIHIVCMGSFHQGMQAGMGGLAGKRGGGKLGKF